MPIAIYDGAKLSNKVFVVEECVFRNCVLTECTLFYSGGDFEQLNTQFQNCQIAFRGAAQRTITFLTMIGMLKPMQPQPVNIQPTTGKMN